MVVIGLTGEVAAGKTTVARAFEQLGAEVIDADRLGHEVLETPAVRNELVDHWGPAILDEAGRVNRRAVAQRVFGNRQSARKEREFLESVTHGRIAERVRQLLADAARRADGPPAVVVDAALLFEAGWDRFCDVTVCVSAPESLRWDRARRRGWTRAQFHARQAAQLESHIKRQRADAVLDNSGEISEMKRQVQAIWNRYVREKHQGETAGL